VSADKLRQRVHRDVGSVLERIEERRRGDGVIDDQRQPVLVGHGRDALEVIDVALGVADGFGVEQAGVLIDGLFKVGRVAGIHEPSLDAEALQRHRELRVGAAIELVARHEVLPGRGDGGDGVEDGSLAGRGCHSTCAAVDCREPFLQNICGGVHKPRVDIAELFEPEEVGRVLGVAEHVAACLVQRYRAGQGVLVRSVTCVKSESVEMIVGHVFRPFKMWIVSSGGPQSDRAQRQRIRAVAQPCRPEQVAGHRSWFPMCSLDMVRSPELGRSDKVQ
jgi:hypothetical protein